MRKSLFLLLLSSLILFSALQAQERCSLEPYLKGRDLFDKKDWEAAEVQLKLAEEQAFNEQNTLCWIQSTGLQAFWYSRTGNLEKSIGLLDSYLEKSNSFPNISEFANEFGWYYIIKARNLTYLGAHQEARATLKAGKEWFEQFIGKRSEEEDKVLLGSLMTSIYPNYAQALEKVGALEEGLDYVSQSFDYAEKNEVSQSVTKTILLTYGAILEQLGRYDEALDFNQKALESPHISPSIKGGLFLNSGTILYFQDELAQALGMVNNALATYRSSPEPTLRQQSESYILLGLIYQKMGDLSKAYKSFEQSEELGTLNFHTSNNPLSAKALTYLGNLMLVKGTYQEAQLFFQESLRRSLPSFSPTHISELPDSSLLVNNMEVWEALVGKATSLALTHDYSSALQHFILLDQQDESLRLSYEYESTKLRATAKSKGYYEEAIRTARILYDQTKDKTYLAQAFAFAEKSKAWVLWEAINQSQAKVNAGIPDSMLNQERSLELQLANLERNIRFEQEETDPDGDLIEEWEREKREIHLELNRLTDQFEASYPKYYQSKYNLDLVSFEEVQRQLGEEEALLEYFWGDSSLFIFCIRHDRELFRELPMHEPLRTAVYTLQSLVGDQASFSGNIANAWEQFDAGSGELYTYLWKPALDLLDSGISVRIIPDGELTRIPFDLLVSPSQVLTLGSSSKKHPASGKPVGRRPYLIYDYTISYDFSATIHEQITIEESKNPLKCLGIAPTFSGDTRLGLSEVEDNFKGINAIKNLVAGKYYEGKSASKANFLASYEQYGILHFATHGGMDINDYQNSWLAFTEVQGKPDEGYLRAAEIYQLQDISARLAVLAACETGIGKLQKGEGLMSLARAFAYAGCPALVSSLWRVPANTTNQLLPDFYSGLKQGLSKSDALRQAKLRYLENHAGIWEFPYFWASFISTGDQSALVLAQPRTFPFDWRGIVALAFILLISLLFIRQKARK